ncbi:MAG TPA: FbpB family small basic protein [Bacillus bacterium]|nr:FbpB family small basic protein [Bacillus sp. (in: firmicutes)]
MKKKKISFEELMENNKVELMMDKKQLEKIEERLEAKRVGKVEPAGNAS